MTYRHLKDAVLDLDALLINTLSGFVVEASEPGYRVVFCFAFYGPDLDAIEQTQGGAEQADTIAQYPDIEVVLDGAASPQEQITELEESDLLGGFQILRIPTGLRGNDTSETKWVVTTHAGSKAERIEWLNSIG